MAQSACLIKTDLSKLSLISPEKNDSWSVSPRESAEDSIEGLRARAVETANWLATQLGARKRLGVLVLDVDETICTWLRSPSAASPVVAATLRSAGQDWGDRFVTGSVERLADPEIADTDQYGKKKSLFSAFDRSRNKNKVTTLVSAAPVLSVPDALIRLWLDELDARAVRIDHIVSLWHAMAAAWIPASPTESDSVIATVLIDPAGRLIWSWSDGFTLLTGGQAISERSTSEESEEEDESDDHPHTTWSLDRAATRLALDWLTWATQLGITPGRIILVGERADELAEALKTRWPETPIQSHEASDPLALTLQKLPDLSETTDPRRELRALTDRPTRAIQTQYRWAAAALVLLALGIAGLGWRFQQSASTLAAQAIALREEQVQIVEGFEDPTIATARNIPKALESKLVELRKKEPPRLPPAPKPIFNEMERITKILANYPDVRLIQLSLDMKQTSTLHLSVPDRRTGEEIRLALASSDGALVWTEAGGSAGDQQLRLNGAWTR